MGWQKKAAVDHANRGLKAFENKRYQEALDWFSEAIKLDPQNPILRSNRGVAHAFLKQFDAALCELDTAFRFGQSNVTTRKHRAWVLCELKRWKEAIQECNDILSLQPAQVEAYYWRGRAMFHTGKADQAVTDLEKALELGTEHKKSSYAMLVSLYGARKDYDKALHLINRGLAIDGEKPIWHINRATVLSAKGWNAEAMEALKHAEDLGLDTLKDEGWASMGRVLERAGEVDKAVQLCEKALAIYPGSYHICETLGTIALHRKDFKSACDYYEKALCAEPRSFVALHNKANAFYSLGLYEEALNNVNLALEDESDQAVSLDLRALCSFELGSTEDALRDLGQAISLKPDDTIFRYRRAWALRQSAQYQRALDDIIEAIKLKKNAINLSEQACILARLERIEEAWCKLNEALKLEPDNSRVWKDKARMHLHVREWSEALASFDKCTMLLEQEQEPICGWLLSDRAYAKGALGMWTAAEEDWQLAAKAGTHLHDMAYVWMRRGDALAATGDFEKALDCFTQAKQSAQRRTKPVTRLDIEKAIEESRTSLFGRALASATSDEKIAAITRLIQRFSSEERGYIERAILFYQLEQFSLALSDLETCLCLNSKNTSALTYKGACLIKLERNEEALKTLDNVLQLKDDLPLALYYRGLARTRLERTEEASQDFLRSAELYDKQGKDKEKQRSLSARDELARSGSVI